VRGHKKQGFKIRLFTLDDQARTFCALSILEKNKKIVYKRVLYADSKKKKVN
jgi:hypothetical protein